MRTVAVPQNHCPSHIFYREDSVLIPSSHFPCVQGFLWHPDDPIRQIWPCLLLNHHLHVLSPTTAKLSSYNRTLWLAKMKLFYYVPLSKENVPTPTRSVDTRKLVFHRTVTKLRLENMTMIITRKQLTHEQFNTTRWESHLNI